MKREPACRRRPYEPDAIVVQGFRILHDAVVGCAKRHHRDVQRLVGKDNRTWVLKVCPGHPGLHVRTSNGQRDIPPGAMSTNAFPGLLLMHFLHRVLPDLRQERRLGPPVCGTYMGAVTVSAPPTIGFLTLDRRTLATAR